MRNEGTERETKLAGETAPRAVSTLSKLPFRLGNIVLAELSSIFSVNYQESQDILLTAICLCPTQRKVYRDGDS